MAASQPAEVEPEINQSLTDLFRHAKKLKFWNQRLKHIPDEVSIDMLAKSVPILTRAEIQDASGLLRLRIPDTRRTDYYTSQTSGSTGKPVEILKFTPSQRIQNAVITLLRQEWAHLDIKKNHARIRGGKEEKENRSWGFPYTMLGQTGMSYTFDIEKRGAAGILEQVIEKDINYIQGNTTLLKALAFEAFATDLTKKLNLNLAMTWAEKVTDEDRDIIRTHLGVEIWDSYSSEELGAIAMQCPNETHLHLLPFFTYIEIVDENDNPCEVGEVGRVIATSLHNFAQPMIRYELGDLASFQAECAVLPGLPVINPEVTRIRDHYVTADGQKMFPRFGKARFVTYRGIKDYQIVVCSDAVLFMYASSTKFTPSQVEEIREDVGKQFGFDLPVEIKRAENSEMLSHWKRKVFYRSSQSYTQLMAAESPEALLELLQRA